VFDGEGCALCSLALAAPCSSVAAIFSPRGSTVPSAALFDAMLTARESAAAPFNAMLAPRASAERPRVVTVPLPSARSRCSGVDTERCGDPVAEERSISRVAGAREAALMDVSIEPPCAPLGLGSS